MAGIPVGKNAGSQGPPDVIKAPSSSEQSAGGVTPSPASDGTWPADATKLLVAAGQSYSQGIGLKPVLEPGRGPIGDDSNVASGDPTGFMPEVTLNKTSGGKTSPPPRQSHAAAVKNMGPPPGFSGPRGGK
jgi:hypothetical protein